VSSEWHRMRRRCFRYRPRLSLGMMLAPAYCCVVMPAHAARPGNAVRAAGMQ